MDSIFEKLNLALEKSGYASLQSKKDFQLLGEGSWHEAYLVKPSREHSLVVRFPKKQVYGKTVLFNRHDMMSEYGGNGLYYQQANKIMPGICPEEYYFSVNSELTYTIESYMGQPINLSATNPSTAKEYGVQLGVFFKKMEEVEPGIEGLGHIIWNDDGFEGIYKGKPQKIIDDEKSDIQSNWILLQKANFSFNRQAIQDKLSWCLEKRSFPTISLTNQDTSPENMIIRNGRVHLIDPRPVLYSGVGAAGDFVNNYMTLFPTYYESPRYIKHQFHKHKDVLYALATGFERAYIDSSVERKAFLKIEQFLQLFSLCYSHYKVLCREIDTETYLRMGDRDVIESRLSTYLKGLETFELKCKS